ncbi:unnamed protein product [Nesidiocoris tenuis]|uniref:Negative elongation factor D n=1 Tax=Nesidiocoris tenuis TaxID=355587 RepID=A0A6H5HE07_9HEMI|nr:unnamed protein product [Nesidiocoris tenuis]
MDDEFDEERAWGEPEAGDESDAGEETMDNPQEVLRECLEKFSTPDYIMEPGIFSQLKRYFQAGGNPEQVIELLSHNYKAVAQMANLVAEWLITGGVKVNDVQAMVENHLKEMILKTFDPKKADTIFSEEGEKMVCHGQHTYVYSQVLLHVLSRETKGGFVMRRLAQEITKYAQSQHDVTPITMALNGAAAHPQACQALSSMLARNTLNPADITVLYRSYNNPEPPPMELIRIPQFLELLVDALFRPGMKLNPEHKGKYTYLLAHATSVWEVPANKKTATKASVNKDDFKQTLSAIEKAHAICSTSKGSTELIAEVNTIYHCIKFPVVSIGIVRWVEVTVMEPSYFKLSTEHTPIHLALLDEVVYNHPLLHHSILSLFIRLFESKQDELEILVQLEMKKMLIERMVNLLSRGCVVPVVKYIKQCWQRGDTDISLIRYFVTEVLEAIAPPYSWEFVALFLPMVENEEITGNIRFEDSDPVSEFISHCKSTFTNV